MDAVETKEWLTPKEVQQLFQLGRTKVYELVTTGELPAIKIGRAVRIRKSEVERFIESNRY